jgi:type II secretory pathway pseudopilin PulG
MPDRLLNAAKGSLRRFPRAVARRLASEAGFAVPTVLLMTVAALGMAGVAITTSIGGQSGTVRDQNSKTALAVAESGVDQALLYFNRYGLLTTTNRCEPLGLTDAEWCGPVTGTTVNGGAVTYWVKPTSTLLPTGGVAWTDLELVGVGTFNEVTRRVHVTAASSSGSKMFAKAAVKSQEGVTLDQNAEIHAGTATNGDVTIGPNAEQCGSASVGIGKELGGGGEHHSEVDCTGMGEAFEDEIILPPVNQGAAATVNDNGRLFSEDRISGNKNSACFSGFNGNGIEDNTCGEPNSRELVVGSNSSVTLGGRVYSFCKLILNSNSSLSVEKGKSVTIYFDSPENCEYEDGTTQLELRSKSRVTAVGGESINLSMLFVGSQDLATKILLNSETSVDGPCEQNFVIYAPYTDIELDSNTRFCGALAGKTVHLDSEAQVWTSSQVNKFILPNVAPHYVTGRFIDCVASIPSAAPDEGC